MSMELENENNALKDKIIGNSLSTEKTSDTIIGDNLSDKNTLKAYISKINPKFFENYDLDEYIGSGSSGYVYKGNYKRNNYKKPVAIKFLIKKKKKESKTDKNSQLAQEISIAKKLHHKNVIETYGYYMKENLNCIVIEYAKYGDMEYFLKKLLKRKVLSETLLNYITKQILEGLKYIHRCKIAHLDIKPTNILLDSNLDVKITDFSVSCSYANFHPYDLVKFPCVGTRKYMSPEINTKAQIKIKENEKFDLYSLGVTIYYLFYGEYPYNNGQDNTNKEENSSQKKEKLIFPEKRKMSKLFKDFLTKILDKDYTKRLNIREALNHPWIQGSKYIMDEKENMCCSENFLISLVTDNIFKFNEYIKEENIAENLRFSPIFSSLNSI